MDIERNPDWGWGEEFQKWKYFLLKFSHKLVSLKIASACNSQLYLAASFTAALTYTSQVVGKLQRKPTESRGPRTFWIWKSHYSAAKEKESTNQGFKRQDKVPQLLEH